jgi:hypothetical protein
MREGPARSCRKTTVLTPSRKMSGARETRDRVLKDHSPSVSLAKNVGAWAIAEMSKDRALVARAPQKQSPRGGP